MRLSLDVLRARKGDCLLLHYGSKDDPHLIVIDGGPSNVYKPQLRPRLVAVRRARKLEEEDPLPVDAVMVSHVDDDHIQGILEMTKELRQPGVPVLAADSLWHNTFDDLLGTTPKELTTAAAFGTASLAGGTGAEVAEDLDTWKVLASIPQGRQLRDDAQALGWKINKVFGKKLVLATSKTKSVDLDGGLRVTVVGPMQPELQALQEAHDDWLREQNKKKTPATAALAAFVDESVPNLSSIVMVVDSGGKRILLTGDARGDKILEGLELVGLMKKKGTLHVDVLKVPHHGSANNLETSFFERITADHYVFSGNGEHGNPERESFEMLFDARGKEPFVIHLTYPVEDIDVERKKDWEKEQAKEKARKKIHVRPSWSNEKNALATFVASKKLGKKIQVVGAKPHVIDLLDPLGF